MRSKFNKMLMVVTPKRVRSIDVFPPLHFTVDVCSDTFIIRMLCKIKHTFPVNIYVKHKFVSIFFYLQRFPSEKPLHWIPVKPLSS